MKLFACLVVCVFAVPTASLAADVVGYELVSSVRAGRTTIDYTYRIRVGNSAPALTDAIARVVSSSAATQIIDSEVVLGNLPAGGTVVSSDTFTLRQDRTLPFNPASLVWTVSGSAASITVPNVVGLTQSAATAAITSAGLAVGAISQQSHGSVPAGSVISQSPAGGTTAPAGTAVDLAVSTGPALVSVPNVIGLTQAAASAAITNASLAIGAVTQQSSASVPAGNVISQNPMGGADVAAGTAVSIVISTGPALVTVPNVVGMTQSAASAAITDAGLVVGAVAQQSSATVPAGNVISHNPIGGSSVAAGSVVNLIVSAGPALASVPNVVGLTQVAASTAISSAGLVVGTITQQSSTTVPAGTVIGQSPLAGTSVAVGSAVDLVISTGASSNPNSTRAVIGTEGGSLTLPNGARLDVPAGAVTEPTELQISVVARPPGALLPASDSLVGDYYELLPDGMSFEEPVTLTLPFSAGAIPNGLTAQEVAIHLMLPDGTFSMIGDANDPEREDSGQRIDTIGNTVSVAIGGFSNYAPLAIVNDFTPAMVTSPNGRASVRIHRPAIYRSVAPVHSDCKRTDMVGSPPKPKKVTDATLKSLLGRSGPVSRIVLHSTNGGNATTTFSGTVTYATAKCTKSFAHYYIGRDGSIFQISEDSIATEHTRNGLGYATNDNSIGIEVFNNVGEPYDGRQIASLVRLLDYLIEVHGLQRPLRNAATGVLVRNPATDSILTHSENDPTNKCDPIGSFQGSLTIERVVDGQCSQGLPWQTRSAAEHPAMVDVVADAIAVLSRTGQHTGVINTSAGDAAKSSGASPGPGGNVSFTESATIANARLGSSEATTAAQNRVLFVPLGQTHHLTAPLPIYTDIIVAGDLTTDLSVLNLDTTGTLYIAPTGRLLLNDGHDGSLLNFTSRGIPIIQGLIDASGKDGSTVATIDGGQGGHLSFLSGSTGTLMVPTIVTRGGDATSILPPPSIVNGKGGAGGSISIAAQSHVLIGGGTGSTANASVPPAIRSILNSSLAPPPQFVGDTMPPPPPFNVTSAGTTTPVAGIPTALQKLPSQLGFRRGLLTSGGIGAFGGAPQAGPGGDGGAISIQIGSAGTLTFRDVDLTTGADIEVVRSNIFLLDGIQHPYFAATGGLGGKGSVGTPAANGGDGGAAGAISLTLLPGASLSPAATGSTILGSIIGFGSPTAPSAPQVFDDVLDPVHVVGTVKQVFGTGNSALYRLRLAPLGGLAGGSGGVPAGNPNGFPGRFGAQGPAGTITGLPNP